MNWKKNRLVVGGLTFAALLGVTLWIVQQRERATTEAPTLKMELPTFDEATITELQLTRANGDQVTLSRQGDHWRVTKPIEADADQSNVKSALSRLKDLEAVRVVATRPENHARLEVDDAQAVRVKIKTADGETELHVGKYGGGTTMVRLNGAEEVLGAKGSIRFVFDRELKQWRNRKVTDIKTDRITGVSFKNDKTDLQFKKDGDAWAQVGGKAIKDFDAKKVAGLVSTAARVTASDFAAPEATPEQAGLNAPNGTVTLSVEGDVPAQADAGTAGPTETVTLSVGNKGDKDTEFYVQRNGDETIYLVSKYVADRLRPALDAFQITKPDPKAKAPAAPPTMPAAGGPGSQQIPPEVMKQIQEQMRQQKAAGKLPAGHP